MKKCISLSVGVFLLLSSSVMAAGQSSSSSVSSASSSSPKSNWRFGAGAGNAFVSDSPDLYASFSYFFSRQIGAGLKIRDSLAAEADWRPFTASFSSSDIADSADFGLMAGISSSDTYIGPKLSVSMTKKFGISAASRNSLRSKASSFLVGADFRI
jgi:hypothetical protein